MAALMLVLLLLTGSVGPAGGEQGGGLPVRPEAGQVTRLYRSALGRAPEPGGFDFWVNQLIEGRTISAVAEFFVTSDEFAQRFDADNDSAFVDTVYRNVLGRQPDSDGRLYWLEQLAAGLGRERLVLFFSESPEFATQTGTALAELPPYQWEVSPVSVDQLGSSWREGCPVGPEDLRLLRFSHVGFDGVAASGLLVVHRTVAEDIAGVFEQLYLSRYPIERVQTVDLYGSDDDASMAANNTSAFNCRPITGGSRWSRHSFGMAIDINPRQNPYVRGATVLPPEGEEFLDRSAYHPAFIREGDVVTRAFDAVGWQWGGRWSSPIDYQHFDCC